MVLAYIGLLQRSGYNPSVEDVEAYAKQPSRTPARYGNISSFWVDAMKESSQYELRRGEDYVSHLKRMNWIVIKRGRITLSELGNALLRGLNSPSIEAESLPYLEVVVDPEDKFAFVRVLHQFNNLGEAMLVDPYLRVEQFIEIAEAAPVNRVLTSSRAFGNAVGKKVYQRAVSATNRGIEVRYTDSLHDRYYIPEVGDLWTLGVSINGISSHLSVLTKLGNDSGGIIRMAYEQRWAEATVLEPKIGNLEEGGPAFSAPKETLSESPQPEESQAKESKEPSEE